MIEILQDELPDFQDDGNPSPLATEAPSPRTRKTGEEPEKKAKSSRTHPRPTEHEHNPHPTKKRRSVASHRSDVFEKTLQILSAKGSFSLSAVPFRVLVAVLNAHLDDEVTPFETDEAREMLQQFDGEGSLHLDGDRISLL